LIVKPLIFEVNLLTSRERFLIGEQRPGDTPIGCTQARLRHVVAMVVGSAAGSSPLSPRWPRWTPVEAMKASAGQLSLS